MMLRFFRHIRKSLMEQNKIRTYLLYALGEIALVMIGILLALQVNNWNEGRKNMASVEIILNGVSDDLLNDVREAERLIRRIDQRSRFIEGFLDSEVIPEDFSPLYSLGFNWNKFVLNNDSFNILNANRDKIPHKYTEIVSSLNSFYNGSDSDIISTQNQIEVLMSEYSNDLAKNHEWYVDFIRGKRNGIIEKYLSEAQNHKTYLARYNQLSLQSSREIRQILNYTRYNYLLLHNILKPDQEYSPYITLPDLEIAPGKVEGLHGTYRTKESPYFEVEINRVNKIHTILFNGDNMIDVDPYILKDLPGDTLGTLADDDILILNRDSDNNISDLTVLLETGFSYKLYRKE